MRAASTRLTCRTATVGQLHRHSALTIVYLSDITSSSKPGSAWNTQGWTFQEFLAPKIDLFYRKDWTLYLGDRSPSHKNSVAINASAFVAFHPGTHRGRQDTRDIVVMHTPIIKLLAISFSTTTCIPGCCSRIKR